jgi:hypothetical protein
MFCRTASPRKRCHHHCRLQRDGVAIWCMVYLWYKQGIRKASFVQGRAGPCRH